MWNQTYAVTGVASGIGAALAKTLREQGHRVIGFDIQDATDTVDQFIFLDLNDPDSIASAAAQISNPVLTGFAKMQACRRVLDWKRRTYSSMSSAPAHSPMRCLII